MKQVWDLLAHYCREKYLPQLNPIEQLMALDFNELMINDWQSIYLEDSGGIRPCQAAFYSRADYLRHFHHFLAKHNQRVSIDKPIVHFDLAGTFRISVVHENVTQSDPLISIRKSSIRTFSRQQLLASGFCQAALLSQIEQLVARRKTIFISGETSSGKTTLLNYLLRFVPSHERLIIIEDTKEIQAPDGANAIYLRTTEQEFQVKELTTSDLVKASLRMRPDRIILGEIRRDEVIDFLHAINTGHHGSLSTGHGNSARDMIARLELLLLESGLPYPAVRRYLGQGIDYIIQLGGKVNRRIDRLTRIDYSDNAIRYSDVA